MKLIRNKADQTVLIGFLVVLVFFGLCFLETHSLPLSFILTLAAIVLVVYALASLAKADISFTFVQEGTAKAVMRFGAFRKMVYAYRFRRLTEKEETLEDLEDPVKPNVFPPGEVIRNEKFKKGEEPKLSWGEKVFKSLGLGGLKLIGWPFVDKIHQYDYHYLEVTEELGGTFKVTPKKETRDFITLKEIPFPMLVIKAESRDLPTVDVLLNVFLRISNPYKAIFTVTDWSKAVQGLIEPFVRQELARLPLVKIFTGRETVKEAVNRALAGLGEKGAKDEKVKNTLSDCKDRYGIRIRTVELLNIDPTKKEVVTTLEAPWTGEKEAARIVALADGEKKRIGAVYGTIKRLGAVGELVRKLEALEESSKGPGRTYFISAPEFGRLFGEESPLTKLLSGLSAEEIERLVKLVREEHKSSEKVKEVGSGG